MRSKQEIFDTVIKHLVAQGSAATMSDGTCQYRTEDGRKCAVGVLIPDDKYRFEMEGNDVVGLINKGEELKWGLPEELAAYDEMLADLQQLHDSVLNRLPLDKQNHWGGANYAFSFAAKLIASKHGVQYHSHVFGLPFV